MSAGAARALDQAIDLATVPATNLKFISVKVQQKQTIMKVIYSTLQPLAFPFHPFRYILPWSATPSLLIAFPLGVSLFRAELLSRRVMGGLL